RVDVGEVSMASRDLGRHVGPRQRLADVAEPRRVLERRLWIDGHAERAVADELAVADGGRAGLDTHDTVGDLQIFRPSAEPLGREPEQRLPSGGGDDAELRPAARDAVTA